MSLIRGPRRGDLVEQDTAAGSSLVTVGARRRCPCGLPVEFDPIDGWQHADGSISHDGEFYGKSVSDLVGAAPLKTASWEKPGDVMTRMHPQDLMPHVGDFDLDHDLVDSMREHGWNPGKGKRFMRDRGSLHVDENPVTLWHTDHGSHVEPGNHRVPAAAAAGLESIPVLVKDRRTAHVASTRWTPDKRVFTHTDGLDHRLFDGEHLRPEVRSYVLGTITAWWAGIYSNWSQWARIYFAGSEASEWTSQTLEGNDDFDVLVGIHYDAFRQDNGQYAAMSDVDISAMMNQQFRAHNGPVTITIDGIPTGPWDRTTYVNQDSWDIRRIKPYAAYDVGADEWVVKPPHLPHWSLSELPKTVQQVLRAADSYARHVLKLPEPERTQQGAALFDSWHSDRSRAFSDRGEGWHDIANLREKWLDQAGLWAELVACRHRANEGLDKAPEDWSNTPPGYLASRRISREESPCTACSGTGEQGTGHECYQCDGSGSAREQDPSIDNANPENGLPVGRDDARGIKPVVAAAQGDTKTFDQLAPHEQRAAATYHEQMIDEGDAESHETPHDYRYELRQEPVHKFLKRYMDADHEFKEAYGPNEFDAHHQETLQNHPIPHYPKDNRWPVIVRDSNPNYVDDGYHRFHSYMRDGATHIPTMRMTLHSPVVAAHRDPHHGDGPFFHGTNADLKPGDQVLPGDQAGQKSHGHYSDGSKVWVSNDSWRASAYGHRTYEVQPHSRPRSPYANHDEHHTTGATVLREVDRQGQPLPGREASRGPFYHWAPKDARDDIAQHGLDHRRSPDFREDAPGVHGNFLHKDERTARDWVPDIGRTHDLYEVRPQGLKLHPDPYDTGDSFYSAQPVPPQQLRRLTSRTAVRRMLPHAEIANLRFIDHPGKSIDAVRAQLKRNTPEYYQALHEHIAEHGVQNPVLLRRRPRGRLDHVMDGTHRTVIAHELGQDIPVGDYDDPKDYDAAYAGPGAREWANKRWELGARRAEKLPKTQKCDYCDSQATKRLLWAEGIGYIPVCDSHEDEGRHRIEVTNKDEVVSVQKIGALAPDRHEAKLARSLGSPDHEQGYEHGLLGDYNNHRILMRRQESGRPLDPEDHEYLAGHTEGVHEAQSRERKRAETGDFKCPQCAGTGMGVWRGGSSCNECHGSGSIDSEAAHRTDTLYHVTDNPHFSPSAHHIPEDNAIAVSERARPGLFAAHKQDVEHWTRGQGYVRPYVAEIQVPHHAHEPGRWGGERFIPAEHLDKVKVKRIIPLSAHGTDYRGPDAREMTPVQHAQHKQRALDELSDEHGFGPEDIDHVRKTWASQQAAGQLWITPQLVMGTAAGLNHARMVNSTAEALAAVRGGLTAVLPAGAWFVVRATLIHLGMGLFDVNQRLRQLGAPVGVTGSAANDPPREPSRGGSLIRQ